VLLLPKHTYFGASFATVVKEAFGLALALFFLGRYGYTLSQRSSVPPFFGLAIIGVVSALLLFENALLTPIIIIDLAVYAAVIYKFGIDYDNKRLILGLLKAGRLTKTEM